MWNPFKRHVLAPAPQTSMLPTDVAEAIECAHLVARTSRSDDDTPRILIGLPGRRFYIENAEQNVREKWPDLNAAQIRRAVSWLQSKAAHHARDNAPKADTRWTDWRPYDMEIDYR